MTNVELKREGNTLILKIDLTQDHGPSATGKTRIVATTHGAALVDPETGAKLNLSVFKK